MDKPRTVPPSPSALLPGLHRLTGEFLDEALAVARGLAPRATRGGFPGSLCVSLEIKHASAIKRKRYWVCRKTDGLRFLLLVCRIRGVKLSLLIGRNMRQDCYIAPIRRMPRDMYNGTLLDGEVVLHQGTQMHHFLTFDASAVCGTHVGDKVFSQRIRAVLDALGGGYAVEKGDAVVMCVKPFVEPSAERLEELLMRRADDYPSDGLVFTPENAPFAQGRNFEMFKWKEVGDHTIDFLLAAAGGLCVRDAATGAPVVVGRLAERVSLGEGAIIECRHVEGDAWSFVKLRPDKTRANDTVTFRGTLLNIQEGIGRDELLALFRA